MTQRVQASLMTWRFFDDRKAMLIDWLTAANEAASQAPNPPEDPSDWKELAAAYHAHHFNCPTCIAAGRGSGYGQRCGVGTALWRDYSR